MLILWVTLEVSGFSGLLMQWTSSSFPPLNRRFTLLLRYANLPFLGLFLPYMRTWDLENDVCFGKISVKLPFSIVYLGLFWEILMKVFPVRISWEVGLLVCKKLRSLNIV